MNKVLHLFREFSYAYFFHLCWMQHISVSNFIFSFLAPSLCVSLTFPLCPSLFVFFVFFCCASHISTRCLSYSALTITILISYSSHTNTSMIRPGAVFVPSVPPRHRLGCNREIPGWLSLTLLCSALFCSVLLYSVLFCYGMAYLISFRLRCFLFCFDFLCHVLFCWRYIAWHVMAWQFTALYSALPYNRL